MKKAFLVLVVVILGIVFISCATTTKQIPGAYLPLADADYTILGETSGEAQGTKILGFIWTGDKTYGTTGGFSLDPVSQVKGNALYKALVEMPEADALVNAKYDIVQTNFFFGTKYEVKVKATGIVYAEGPIVAK
jgi:hypothetical protein